MYSTDDLKSLHSFLKSTGEGNLKKMLVGGTMTDNHLRLLLKIARAVSDDDFAGHAEGDLFPKVKMSPAESAIKESFWSVCLGACVKLGLLAASKAA